MASALARPASAATTAAPSLRLPFVHTTALDTAHAVSGSAIATPAIPARHATLPVQHVTKIAPVMVYVRRESLQLARLSSAVNARSVSRAAHVISFLEVVLETVPVTVRASMAHATATMGLLALTALSWWACARNCSGHGRCVDGQCDCHSGFSGPACDLVTGLCPRNCTGHGECDELTATCICDPGYVGKDCGKLDAKCKADCNGHGTCEAGQCWCAKGFGGSSCEVQCVNRCSGHGACDMDGNCKCDDGWSHPKNGAKDCSRAIAVQQVTKVLLTSGSLREDVSGPFSIFLLCAVALLLFSCILIYVLNICRGQRGLNAVPFFRYFAASIAYSDYQLKPNPMPRPQQM